MSKYFVEGAINPEIISKYLYEQENATETGADIIFLGRIRADIIEGKKVRAIEYSVYQEMAEIEIEKIISQISKDFNDINSIKIFHSNGIVEVGKVSLFIIVSGKHRKQAALACAELVNLIKEKVPVWGKELVSESDFFWKENKK